jgi:hypothetical protein
MMLKLVFLAALAAVPVPQNGWIVEFRGYHYHSHSQAKGWIIELRDFIKHRQPIEAVELQYHNDLSAFFNQFSVHVDPVEAVYVDDLPAFFNDLKN